MQLRWTAVSNWLFTLICDQFRPYELWFWLEGRSERGSATSLPRFTAGFSVRGVCGRSVPVGSPLAAPCSLLSASCSPLAALPPPTRRSLALRLHGGAARSRRSPPPRPFQVRGAFLARTSGINSRAHQAPCTCLLKGIPVSKHSDPRVASAC